MKRTGEGRENPLKPFECAVWRILRLWQREVAGGAERWEEGLKVLEGTVGGHTGAAGAADGPAAAGGAGRSWPRLWPGNDRRRGRVEKLEAARGGKKPGDIYIMTMLAGGSECCCRGTGGAGTTFVGGVSDCEPAGSAVGGR